MENLFITQIDGSKARVTDLEASLKQAYDAISFHVHKKNHNHDIQFPYVHKTWEHVRDQLEELRGNQLRAKLEQEGWTCTDPNCNQFCKPVNKVRFDFREDRIINPETKEREVYESQICLFNYSAKQIYDACASFGYDKKQVKEWIEKENNNALIAECIFELEN